MQMITLKVDDNVSDKFLWLLKHFSSDEIEIINQTIYQSDKEIESLRLLSSIKKGLNDIKTKKTHPIDKLWEQLDD